MRKPKGCELNFSIQAKYGIFKAWPWDIIFDFPMWWLLQLEEEGRKLYEQLQKSNDDLTTANERIAGQFYFLKILAIALCISSFTGVLAICLS